MLSGRKLPPTEAYRVEAFLPYKFSRQQYTHKSSAGRNGYLAERILSPHKRAKGAIEIAFDMADHVGPLRDLAGRYADRRPDLADLCLIRMSELYPRHSIVTVDSDFRFYRRKSAGSYPHDLRAPEVIR